jgi:hypothetical protein
MALTDQIEARLLRYFGASTLAQAFLCPSGTDALLTTAMLVAAERPGKAITAILPSASETGSGVPMAAIGHIFDGLDRGTPVNGEVGKAIEISLRAADGSLLSEDAVNGAFTAAAAAAGNNVIVYLTHSSKTGLIAPVCPPDGADVIVDACQARIAPETVVAYLRRGWPVVVTGSKFFGGPAFSGAILFPRARPRQPLPAVLPAGTRLGTALRWIATLPTIDAFEPVADSIAAILSDRIAVIEQGFVSNPALVPVGGLQPRNSGWANLPSIFVFGMRDPIDRQRLLSTAKLRPFYEWLARRGVLLGQPVSLGRFGGLRIAIGARDLLDGQGDTKLARVFTALQEATASPRPRGGQ